MDCSSPGSSGHRDPPGKNTRVDSHFLLQEIFSTQGSNPCLLCPLQWQEDFFSLPLVPPGKNDLILTLTNYVCKDSISKQGHILSFQVDMTFWETQSNLLQVLTSGSARDKHTLVPGWPGSSFIQAPKQTD